jgi:hypothetical protein
LYDDHPKLARAQTRAYTRGLASSGSAYVAVVGPGEATPAELDAAREVGELLGARGAVLVCGGLGGVMESASEGVRRGGGIAVGLLPGSDRTQGNAHLSVAIATGIGELRNGLVVRAADAVIGIGGSWGTLSELALAARTGTPVVLLDSWRVHGPAGDERPLGVRVGSPREAVDRALELASRRQRHAERGPDGA